MNFEYFHLAPVILSDSLFFAMRPDAVLTGTSAAREASYIIAESMMVEHLGTFLLPTTITGTLSYFPGRGRVRIPHHNLHSVDQVLVWSRDSSCNCTLTSTDGCANMIGSWGVVDLRVINSAYIRGCGGGPAASPPYKYEVTWTAGLPTGTAALDKRLHLALALQAEEILKDFTDPGAHEGGPGDAGIQGFSTLGYQETRVKLKDTTFGQTAMGNYVARMVKHLVKQPPLRFS